MFGAIKRILSSAKIPSKMALIVRNDIGMTKGKSAAQCAHAAILCYEKCSTENPEMLQSWLMSGQPKIVLKVNSLDEINEISKKANESKVICAIIRDAGRTQLSPGTITALGLGPDYDENINKLVGHLKLF